ncbi:MAG: hypothetical protein ABIS36_18780 [Chryseolinea sp.]
MGHIISERVGQVKAKPYYQKKDISPYFWLNGKIPDSAEWEKLAGNNFAEYKLKIGGLVITLLSYQ